MKIIKLEIWGKPNVSPPCALSPIGGDLGGCSSSRKKSRGPYSKALALGLVTITNR